MFGVAHTGEDLFDQSELCYLQPTWSDSNHRRAIMAALVQGVYVLEKDRQAGFWNPQAQVWKNQQQMLSPRWWLAFQYELEQPIMDERWNTVIGAVFRRKSPSSPEQCPQKIVAFRGTILKCGTVHGDVEEDLQIICQQLHLTSRFAIALELVRKLVVYHGPNSVCLTGHSKGAALGLLVGRKLAEEGSMLEAHLFNPPCAALPTESLNMPRLSVALQMAHNALAAGVATVLKDNKTREQERYAFLSIRNWHPHLYLNSKDPICSAYIGYFGALVHAKQRGGGLMSKLATPQSIRGVLRSRIFKDKARPDHLIPSAHLQINNSKEDRDLKNAHKLEQWRKLHLHVHPLSITYGDNSRAKLFDEDDAQQDEILGWS